jgi:hypothetical protein
MSDYFSNIITRASGLTAQASGIQNTPPQYMQPPGGISSSLQDPFEQEAIRVENPFELQITEPIDSTQKYRTTEEQSFELRPKGRTNLPPLSI